METNERVVMFLKLIAVLSVCFFLPVQARGDDGYYIERNGVIEHAPQGDPSQEHPDVWRFKVYRKGEATSGTPWGGITGKTLDSITDELKSDQADEVSYDHVCECDHPGWTYFNPLGPIAVYYTTPTHNFLDQTDKMVGRLADLEKKLEEVATIAGEEKVSNPFKIVDSPAWTFLKQLHEVKKKFAELNNKIYAYNNEPLEVINKGLDSMNDDLNNLENNLAPKMQKSLPKGNSGGLIGNWTSPDSDDLKISKVGQNMIMQIDGVDFRNLVVTGNSFRVEWYAKGVCSVGGDIEALGVWAPGSGTLSDDGLKITAEFSGADYDSNCQATFHPGATITYARAAQ